MPFQDFDAFAEPLQLPISGKTYTIPACPASLGLRITLEPETVEGTLSDLYRLLLGDAWDEMVADGVSMEALQRAGLTALADIQTGREMAELVWEAGIRPEALAARAAARAAELESTQSPSTDAETSTPSPASSSGTTSPPTTPRAPRTKKAPPSTV